MRWRRVPGGVFVVLQHGDDVHASLLQVAVEAEVRSGALAGLGAADDIQIAYYDLARRAYDRLDLDGDHEVCGMTGNLTLVDGRPFAHVHAVLGGRDFAARAGHLMRARCGATLEIFVHDFGPEAIHRSPDPAIGLNLCSL